MNKELKRHNRISQQHHRIKAEEDSLSDNLCFICLVFAEVHKVLTSFNLVKVLIPRYKGTALSDCTEYLKQNYSLQKHAPHDF